MSDAPRPDAAIPVVHAPGVIEQATTDYQRMVIGQHNELLEKMSNNNALLSSMHNLIITLAKAVMTATISAMCGLVGLLASVLLIMGRINSWEWMLLMLLCLSPVLPVTKGIIEKIVGKIAIFVFALLELTAVFTLFSLINCGLQ